MLDGFIDFLARQPVAFLGLAAFHFGILLISVKLYLASRRRTLPKVVRILAQTVNGVLIMACALIVAVNLTISLSLFAITKPGEQSVRVTLVSIAAIFNFAVLPAQLAWITVEIMFIRTLRPRSRPGSESERNANDPDRATSADPADQ